MVTRHRLTKRKLVARGPYPTTFDKFVGLKLDENRVVSAKFHALLGSRSMLHVIHQHKNRSSKVAILHFKGTAVPVLVTDVKKYRDTGTQF